MDLFLAIKVGREAEAYFQTYPTYFFLVHACPLRLLRMGDFASGGSLGLNSSSAVPSPVLKKSLVDVMEYDKSLNLFWI